MKQKLTGERQKVTHEMGKSGCILLDWDNAAEALACMVNCDLFYMQTTLPACNGTRSKSFTVHSAENYINSNEI